MQGWMERLAVACLLALAPAVLGGCPFDLGDGDPAVVVMTSTGEVIAFDDEGNAPLWSHDVDAAEYGDLLADGGTVFVLTGGSEVLALDDLDGALVWTEDINGTTVGQLALSGDTLFAQTADEVVALDADSGEILWSESFDDLSGAMATGDGALFVGGDPVRRLDPADGTQQASYEIGDPYVPAMAVTGGRVIVGGRYEVVSLFPDGLSQDWFHTLENSSTTGLVADGGDVYVTTDNEGLLGFEVGDSVPFLEAMLSTALDAPDVSDGTVYVSESFGDVYAVDAATGDETTLLQSTYEHRGGLAVSGNTVFLAAGASLVGIDAIAGGADWEQSPGGTVVALEAL